MGPALEGHDVHCVAFVQRLLYLCRFFKYILLYGPCEFENRGFVAVKHVEPIWVACTQQESFPIISQVSEFVKPWSAGRQKALPQRVGVPLYVTKWICCSSGSFLRKKGLTFAGVFLVLQSEL